MCVCVCVYIYKVKITLHFLDKLNERNVTDPHHQAQIEHKKIVYRPEGEN